MTMPATPTAQPTSGLSDQLNQVLKSAPELSKSPGLSVGIAAAGGNVTQNAQATARGTNAISDNNAHSRVAASVGGGDELTSALNWFGNHVVAKVGSDLSPIAKGAEQVGSQALGVLNKPLQIVQHEYRYLHDVEARHGMGAAVLEGIGIAAGAAGGFALGGGYGAVLGAEAATGAEGQLFYKDSWDRTTNGNTYVDPNTGQPVSLGRDVISELSRVFPELGRGTEAFKITSGIVDGIADLNVGGTEIGGLLGDVNSAEGASGVLGNYFGGTGAATAEDVDRAYAQYGSVRRAFSDIASKSAGEIAATPAYRSIAQQHDLLTALGNADSAEDVAQIFKDTVRANEMVFSGKLPTLAITRVPFQVAREAMENSSLPGVQRFSKAITRLPDAWDDVLKGFSGSEFDPTSTDDGTVGIYRTARFTEDRRTAAMIADQYTNAPDLATKIRIYRNLTLSTLFNLAGFRGVTEGEYLAMLSHDPEWQKNMARALDEALAGGMFGKEAVYGLDDEGRNLSLIHDADSKWEYGAGILENQTGKLHFIDLEQARRGAKMLAGERDYFGRAGEFAFNHVTQGIFKPLVLLTPSYAMHIALAELIPNSLRLGVKNMVRSGLEINASRLGVKVDADEANAIEGLAWKLVRGIRKVTPNVIDNTTEKDLQLAARYIEFNDGHLVAPGLSSGHDYASEVVDREEQSVSLMRRNYYESPKKTSKTFGIFGLGHEQYMDAWQSWLREIAHSPSSQIAAQELFLGARDGRDLEESSGLAADAVANYLRSLPPGESGRMIRSIDSMTAFKDVPRPVDMDAYDEWARVIVANVRGAVRGADRSMNIPLLDHIINGETVDDDELNAIPNVARPLNVKGRELVPDGNSMIQRIANVGFRKVLNPMVNFLSREPIAFAEFKEQYLLLEPLVDAGKMDDDEAMTLAMTRTVQNTIRNVHNLTDRTQWTVTFRNWAPFYFAQEQAYRRMGRLLAEDPGAFRKYQLMISNIGNVGQIFGGKNGEGYLVLPGTGFLTAGVAAAAQAIGLPVEGSSPIGMGWDLSASSVIFPLSAGFRPDLGPLVSIPVQAISQIFPETLSPVLKADMTATANTILGPTATDPIYEQMIPNTILQRLMQAWVPGFNSRTFNSTTMQVIATLDAEGKVPPPTAGYRAMQVFLDRVKMQTRIMYTMKAIVGAVTPISPELSDSLYNKANGELSADMTKMGSASKGIQEFLSKNPDATPYTVFQSANLTGADVPSSVQAENWINENYGLVTKYPNAGILLMPMNVSTKYNAGVYNEQIAQSLRSKLDPDQWTEDGQVPSYIDQLYISAGNSIVLDRWYPQYEKQLAGLTGTEKYDAEHNWQTTLSDYALKNPVWGNWWNSDARESERAQAIQQMKSLLASPEAPKTEIADDARTLLKGYTNYQNQLKYGSQDGFEGESESTIDNDWKTYLYSAVQENPNLSNLVTGLFLSLPETGKSPVTGAAGIPGTFSAQAWNKAA